VLLLRGLFRAPNAACDWRLVDVSTMSVRAFLTTVAKIGGHLNRNGNGPPGWLVLWRGWSTLQLRVEGVRGAKR